MPNHITLLYTVGVCIHVVGVSMISFSTLSGSPSVTSLTYDNQSRTLTCTSTGGPATTVAWRRDGAVITPNATTYQQTKRVVDPVTGTYQTMLTTDSSVGQSGIVGTYNCTVENARGRSSITVAISSNGEWTYKHTCTIVYTSCILVTYLDLGRYGSFTHC